MLPFNWALRGKRLPAIGLALSVISSGAPAAPTKLLGFDDMSCQAWTKSKDDAELRGHYLSWVRGFLSGHNYANQSAQVSPISVGTVEGFVNRFCAEKPQSQFSDAAFRMSDQFSGRNAPITR